MLTYTTSSRPPAFRVSVLVIGFLIILRASSLSSIFFLYFLLFFSFSDLSMYIYITTYIWEYPYGWLVREGGLMPRL